MRIPHNEPLGSDIGGGLDKPQLRGSAKVDPAKTVPIRKCILTGRHGERAALIRLAISPEGPDGVCGVFPDVFARAPGRGAWIGVTRAELDAAMTAGKNGGKLKGALARAFKGTQLTIPADLGALVEAALIRAFTDRLGLEMRSGKLLVGSDRIAEKARAGRVAWLAHAADAGEDGSRKLDQALRVGLESEGGGERGEILPLDRNTLSVALGRDNVVHMALGDAAAAVRLDDVLRRLRHFMGQEICADVAIDAAFEEAEFDGDDAGNSAASADVLN